MLVKTHRWISEQIAGYLKLNERQEALLSEASIIPDRMEDFPHHHGKKREIMDGIEEARLLFLKDDDECYYHLGMALHYFQDGWTLKPRVRDKHTQWEREIHSSARAKWGNIHGYIWTWRSSSSRS